MLFQGPFKGFLSFFARLFQGCLPILFEKMFQGVLSFFEETFSGVIILIEKLFQGFLSFLKSLVRGLSFSKGFLKWVPILFFFRLVVSENDRT